MTRILVTGGAGFIGSALIRHLLQETDALVVNVDKLTYAANRAWLEEVAGKPKYVFERADICDAVAMRSVFDRHRPHVVVHLAAESHVDRSIDGPEQFIETNIVGTFRLLDVACDYWQRLDASESREVPISPCLDRRSVRIAWTGGPFLGNDALCPAVTLLCEQGGV